MSGSPSSTPCPCTTCCMCPCPPVPWPCPPSRALPTGPVFQLGGRSGRLSTVSTMGMSGGGGRAPGGTGKSISSIRLSPGGGWPARPPLPGSGLSAIYVGMFLYQKYRWRTLKIQKPAFLSRGFIPEISSYKNQNLQIRPLLTNIVVRIYKPLLDDWSTKISGTTLLKIKDK